MGLFLLGVTKVMIDEIAHEASTGWDSRGEFVILIAVLLIHLAFNLYYMTIIKTGGLNRPPRSTMNPGRSGSSRVLIMIALVIIGLLTSIPRVRGWNEASRLATVQAMVEHQTLRN